MTTILSDLFSSRENVSVHSEVILNVLRESDGLVVGTSDIASRIGMSRDGARNRLRQLETEARVVSQEIGSTNDYTLVWGLNPTERKQPIHPEIDRLVRACDWTKQLAWSVIIVGIAGVLVGFGLLFAGLTAVFLKASVRGLPSIQLIAYGYSAVGGGGAAALVGGVFRYGAVVTERVAEWYISQPPSGEVT